MKNRIFLALSLLTSLCLTSIASAAIVYYDQSTKSNWLSAAHLAGGYYTENFAGGAITDPALGHTSFNDDGAFHDGTPSGFAAGVYVATPKPNEVSFTTWTFAEAISYWGADFNLEIPGGPGSGLQIILDWDGGTGGTWLNEISRNTGGPSYLHYEFWGFFSDTAFTSLTVMAGTQLSPTPDGSVVKSEFHGMQNMRYESEVPEPTTMLLFGAGLIGLASLRRRSN